MKKTEITPAQIERLQILAELLAAKTNKTVSLYKAGYSGQYGHVWGWTPQNKWVLLGTNTNLAILASQGGVTIPRIVAVGDSEIAMSIVEKVKVWKAATEEKRLHLSSTARRLGKELHFPEGEVRFERNQSQQFIRAARAFCGQGGPAKFASQRAYPVLAE
jgi:hypothetical protein